MASIVNNSDKEAAMHEPLRAGKNGKEVPRSPSGENVSEAEMERAACCSRHALEVSPEVSAGCAIYTVR